MRNTPGPFPHPASSPGVGPIKLADGLGWASAALGVPMLIAPTRFPRWIGIKSDRKAVALTAFVGVRELSATFTINGMRHRRVGAWARVGGDTMDLFLLGRSFLTRRQSTPRLLGAIGFVAGIYAADIYTAIQLSRAEGVGMRDGSTSHGVGMTDETDTDVRTAVTILRSEDEVRSAFADFGWAGFDPSTAESRGEVRFTPRPRRARHRAARDHERAGQPRQRRAAPVQGAAGDRRGAPLGQDPGELFGLPADPATAGPAGGRGRLMRATVWSGRNTVQVENVPDPQILNSRDAIVKITSTTICGSDLHLYDGYVPTMRSGDILGHEFMGEVVEVGADVKNLSRRRPCRGAVPDRLRQLLPVPPRHVLDLRELQPQRCAGREAVGPRAGGIYGYSSLTGGYAGGQAEYARVPFADVGPIKIENSDLTDDQVLFLSDAFPTGYYGADVCDIKAGDVVAVWGAGAVGLFAMASAKMLGAERVIAIDRFDYRLDKAREAGADDVLDYEKVSVPVALKELTGGRGPDACIDCVGLESHHPNPVRVRV